MDGIYFLTNASGAKTAIMIDLDALRQRAISGREAVQYLSTFDEIKEIIDLELSRKEPDESWQTVRRRLKKQNKLRAHI
ncbi:MAG: hypothetical protein LBS12_05950 [Prevotellaceae bacterium]|nr:hypothetical protein [Prevotellaceae bacterium]